MTASIMLGATKISLNPAEGLSGLYQPAAIGEQSQFQQTLLHVASTLDAASSVADRAASVPAVSEVQRATVQAIPPGERVLQALSSMHRSNPVPSATGGGVAAISKTAQPRPAAQPLSRSQLVGTSPAGKPEGVLDFDTLVASLQDVYKGVVEVSLVSKSTSAVSSSLNKLLSAG
ncbi:nodulation protein NolB [Bradyrhizobium sp. CB3481]|uniref:nodulation protein NolB n=1 Tax=Bradyrhizobium sp. CB3481 TaxID=3039158 RepID=UPI0024B19BC9|nr:nodulation protein NolB [Bradyrhizobium sp. CB3481]WFU14792.1 nodulation protein NolB [Bradyrhizobium sp. CB3481]